LQPYFWEGKSWQLHDQSSVDVVDGSANAIVEMIKADRQCSLIDFDDHLEDVSLDWFNEELLAGL